MAVSPWEKVSRTKGEQPGPPAKCPKVYAKWERRWGYSDNQEVSLEAAIL